jgi:hypothetical protein
MHAVSVKVARQSAAFAWTRGERAPAHCGPPTAFALLFSIFAPAGLAL